MASFIMVVKVFATMQVSLAMVVSFKPVVSTSLSLVFKGGFAVQ